MGTPIISCVHQLAMLMVCLIVSGCRPIPPVAAKIVSFICCSLSFLLVLKGGGVVGNPLGEAVRGAAEDLFHLAGEGRCLPDLLGVPSH